MLTHTTSVTTTKLTITPTAATAAAVQTPAAASVKKMELIVELRVHQTQSIHQFCYRIYQQVN